MRNYNIMILTGQGQITSPPDVAVIRLGVVTRGEILSEIQSENSMISQSILQSLEVIGVSDISTFQYTIDKIYDFDNGVQIDRGYSVRNILEIKTSNMEQVGFVIDTAVSAGANVVDLISFESSNRELYQKALILAMANATEKARSISTHLGIQFDPIPVKITEESFPQVSALQYQRSSIETPIVPGNIMVEALLTVEFIY